jgi:hypothetical protein
MRIEAQPCRWCAGTTSNGILTRPTTARRTDGLRNDLPNCSVQPRTDCAYALHARVVLGRAKPPGPLPCTGACLYSQGAICNRRTFEQRDKENAGRLFEVRGRGAPIFTMNNNDNPFNFSIRTLPVYLSLLLLVLLLGKGWTWYRKQTSQLWYDENSYGLVCLSSSFCARFC